jgi:putative restriction endonuclease
MIDACHIVPFSEGYNNTLTNGIALCPNLHRAFDRGLIFTSDYYKILVNRNSVENQKSAFNLSQFAGKQIFLPYAEELYLCHKITISLFGLLPDLKYWAIKLG